MRRTKLSKKKGRRKDLLKTLGMINYVLVNKLYSSTYKKNCSPFRQTHLKTIVNKPCAEEERDQVNQKHRISAKKR